MMSSFTIKLVDVFVQKRKVTSNFSKFCKQDLGDGEITFGWVIVPREFDFKIKILYNFVKSSCNTEWIYVNIYLKLRLCKPEIN